MFTDSRPKSVTTATSVEQSRKEGRIDHADTYKNTKDTALACYNFNEHRKILIIFGRNVAKQVGNQTALYFLT